MSDRVEDRTNSDPKRQGASSVETERAGGQSAASRDDAPDAETIDRDAMGQADYGGTRDDTGQPAAAPGQQGGASRDHAEGGGREPTVDRDRDYDPDGSRVGL